MPPISLNRRRFLGCSAAASLALSQGAVAEPVGSDAEARPVRLGLIAIGNRGTSLLRTLLELPGTEIVTVCDPEPKHWRRGQGLVEKARGHRRDAFEAPRRLVERHDVEAVLVAVPCDLHEAIAASAIIAG